LPLPQSLPTFPRGAGSSFYRSRPTFFPPPPFTVEGPHFPPSLLGKSTVRNTHFWRLALFLGGNLDLTEFRGFSFSLSVFLRGRLAWFPCFCCPGTKRISLFSKSFFLFSRSGFPVDAPPQALGKLPRTPEFTVVFWNLSCGGFFFACCWGFQPLYSKQIGFSPTEHRFFLDGFDPPELPTPLSKEGPVFLPRRSGLLFFFFFAANFFMGIACFSTKKEERFFFLLRFLPAFPFSVLDRSMVPQSVARLF